MSYCNRKLRLFNWLTKTPYCLSWIIRLSDCLSYNVILPFRRKCARITGAGSIKNRIYSPTKLHKIGYPIRLVVSYCSASTVNSSRFLNNKITKYCQFKTTSSIKNSHKLIGNNTTHYFAKQMYKCLYVTYLYHNISPIDDKNFFENVFSVNNNITIKNEIMSL